MAVLLCSAVWSETAKLGILDPRAQPLPRPRPRERVRLPAPYRDYPPLSCVASHSPPPRPCPSKAVELLLHRQALLPCSCRCLAEPLGWRASQSGTAPSIEVSLLRARGGGRSPGIKCCSAWQAIWPARNTWHSEDRTVLILTGCGGKLVTWDSGFSLDHRCHHVRLQRDMRLN